MADRYDVKSNNGKVIGSIEKSSPTYDHAYEDGYENVRAPILKWVPLICGVIGGIGGALNGLKWGVGLGYFVGYIIGGAAIGLICGLVLGWILSTIAVFFVYITRNPKEVLIILAVVGGAIFLFVFRDFRFH